jgi:hypothetical protein
MDLPYMASCHSKRSFVSSFSPPQAAALREMSIWASIFEETIARRTGRRHVAGGQSGICCDLHQL